MSFAAIFTSVWAVPRTSLTDNLRILTSRTLPVTCDNVVLLSATVIGDPLGHTFEWEQMSGTPVIWLESVYQTNVMFQQPGARDDKIFHFIVDKGKSIEKRYEVLVTAIPTDFISTSIIRGAELCTCYAYSGDKPNIRAVVPAFGEPGSIEVNNPIRAVIFDSPYKINNSNNIPSVSLLERVNGQYEILAILSYDTPISLIAAINILDTDKSYVLNTNTYGTPGYGDPISFSTASFSSNYDLAITDSDKLRTSIVNNGNYSVSSMEVITRELVGLDLVDNIASSGLMRETDSLSIITEIMTRTLQTVDGLDTTDLINSSVNTANMHSSAIVEVKQFQYSSLG